MKQLYGMSQNGNLAEAVKNIRNPKLLILASNPGQFEQHVKELEELYPQVPSIGCIAMSYGDKMVENGVSVTALTEQVEAVTNVIEHVSTMPVKYIGRLEKDVASIRADSKDTVCIDFCTGNDACVLTTIYSVFEKKHISLTGGTGADGKVSVNGKIYEDAAVYALVKNLGGKIKVYKENIYVPMEGYRFVASKTDKSKYIIGELNGKPAKQVYTDILNISEKDVVNQTFKNPLGKMNGDDIYIISIKEVVGNALACFRQVNDTDVLTLLQQKDYRDVVEETLQKIQHDFLKVSGIFSINCLFRYQHFQKDDYFDKYLQSMGALGIHTGIVGYGEHYNAQFVNQTMSGVVFE